MKEKVSNISHYDITNIFAYFLKINALDMPTTIIIIIIMIITCYHFLQCLSMC